jgi:hypothetical protein
MNEQMKAVGRQAGLVFIEDGVYGQRWYSSKCGLDATEYEKLVRVIVKECASIADDGYGSAHFGNGIAGYQLLQHFGVEE